MSVIPPGPWNEHPELWDTLVLDEKPMPGIATVDVRRANNWDDKKAKGQNSQEREYTGAGVASVRITLVWWTSAHWDEIKSVLFPLVDPDPTKEQYEARSINHAVCEARKVTHITIDDVVGPTAQDQGTSTIVIEATEHRKPTTKGATGTATGSGGGGGAQTGSDCEKLGQQLGFLQSQLAEAYVQQANGYAKMNNPNFWQIPKNYLEGDAEVTAANLRIANLNGEIAGVVDSMNGLGCSNASATGAGDP